MSTLKLSIAKDGIAVVSLASPPINAMDAALLEKLRKGSSGAWGPIPMPPNPDLPEQDARALVRWILDGTI